MINISQKLAVLSIAMVLFGSLPIFYLAYTSSQSSLEVEIKAKMAMKSGAIMSSVDRFIYERLQDIGAAAEDPDLIAQIDNEAAAEARLLAFKLQSPLYARYSLFGPKRVRLADSEGSHVGKLHRRNSYWLGLDSAGKVMHIAISESLDQPVLHFAAKIVDDTDQTKAVLVSEVLIDSLYAIFQDDVLSQMSEEVQQAMSISLVDPTGLVLYSNRRSADVLKAKHRAFTTFKWQTDRNQMANNAQGDFALDDQLYFFARQKGYLDYCGNGLILLIQLPKSVALAPAAQLGSRMYLILIGVSLLAIAIAILVGRYFAGPVKDLTALAQQLADGTLNIANDTRTRTFRRGDEIGILARSFRQMAQELERQMKEQVALNTQIAAQKEEIETALEDISKKNKNITSSMNYALRIQTAFLPEREGLGQLFPHSFLIFKPKDIVSGDFYWFRKIIDPATGNEQMVLATVDCTGHGVPGALMTMVGQNLLYEAAVQERLTDPAQVIQRMDENLGRMLRNSQGQGTPEGMDIALCFIDLAKGVIQFAGAHQSAYVIRDGGLHELKGDRFAIGDSTKRSIHRSINTQQWKICPGDQLFLVTDGFSDQFGGLAGPVQTPTKYGKKRLRAVLETAASLASMGDQRAALTSALTEWQGQQPQTDDITVIGIKI